MKKVYTLTTLLLLAVLANSQNSWDTIMTGITPAGSKYPGCYNVTKAGGKIYGSASTALYQTANNGTTWKKKNIGSLFIYSPKDVYEAASGRLLATGGSKYAVVKSDDNGTTWDTTMAFGNGSSGEGLIFTSNGSIYAAIWNNQTPSANGIYVSTNNGDTWTVKYAFTQLNQKVWTLHKVTDSVFVAGTNYGLYRTTDAGTTWNGVGLNGSLNQVLRIIKHPNGTLYAATSGNGIQKSTDNGQSWAASSMVSTSSTATYYDIDADQAGNIYISYYNSGVMQFNPSETFQQLFATDTNGLFNKRIRCLFIDESGSTPISFIACEGATSGTDQNGYFFRRGIPSGSGTSVAGLALKNIQVYPNPASGIVTVSNLPGYCYLKLMDLSGKIISTQPASHQAGINVSHLPGGIYLLQVEKEGAVMQKKIVKQ